MALHPRLSLFTYNLASASSARTDWSDAIESLHITTNAQGGWADLTTQIKIRDARLVPPELRQFSKIIVTDGPFVVFAGRIDEPGVVVQANNGNVVEITAMGAATVTKDDPRDFSYTNQTAQAILADQITQRAAYLPFDADTSQILPSAPSATYTRPYNGKTIEEILNDLTTGLGDYAWQMWDHPRNRDAASFPTWQLSWHPRDTTTVHYSVALEEVEVDVRPSVEYSYNSIQLFYVDSATGLPSSLTVTDSRLNANKSQGTAPFPYRLLRKDVGNLQLSGGEAASIANAYLAQYQNGGFKITFTLAGVRDASGNPIPLWQVRADHNIAVPYLAPLSPTLPLQNVANQTLFYIYATTFSETEGQAPTVTLECNSFTDSAAFLITRLQYAADAESQSAKGTATIQLAGAGETGFCGGGWVATAAGQTYEVGVNFKAILSATPSSITLTGLTTLNVASVAAAQLTQYGFQLQVTSTAAGAVFWRGKYTTIGN